MTRADTEGPWRPEPRPSFSQDVFFLFFYWQQKPKAVFPFHTIYFYAAVRFSTEKIKIRGFGVNFSKGILLILDVGSSGKILDPRQIHKWAFVFGSWATLHVSHI